MAVGERIRQNRLNKKMTQKELGEKQVLQNQQLDDTNSGS